MQPQNKQTKKRIGKYLMTLNWMLKMVKMVNFMLYAFYHNKKYFRGKKGEVKYLNTSSKKSYIAVMNYIHKQLIL